MNHEENPVRIKRIRTQVMRTSIGKQWAEAFCVIWTDPASGSRITRTVGDRKAALRLKRDLLGLV
jgi:hypothetical protein